MARINFSGLFRQHIDGGFEPVQRIRIGSVEIGPGFRFKRGVLVAGIDLSLFVGRDFEVDQEASTGVAVVRSIYQ